MGCVLVHAEYVSEERKGCRARWERWPAEVCWGPRSSEPSCNLDGQEHSCESEQGDDHGAGGMV